LSGYRSKIHTFRWKAFCWCRSVAVEDIQRIVAQIKNIGILITDHNVQETLAITDKTYLMFEGGNLKAGIPEELVEDEMVRRVYLGKIWRKKKLEFW
jgi:lipopolysaccharide export system ATP-binding protein